MDKQKKIKGGFILLARQLKYSNIWDKPAWWLKVWVYLLKNVNWTDNKKTGIEKGSKWFTYDMIYHDCKLKQEGVRLNSITKLIRGWKQSKQLSTQKSTRGFIITIINYSFFQNPESYEVQTEVHSPVHGKSTQSPHKVHTIPKEGISSNKKEITTLLKQGEKEYKIKTPVQYIVCSYKSLKGVKTDDRGWDKANFGRYGRAAKSLLEAFSGDYKKAAAWMKIKAEDFNRKGLTDWTLETLKRWAWDSKGDRNDDNYSQVDVAEET